MGAAGLSRIEIMKMVNRYIGVEDGYLGDFSYRTHTDFYPEYCDLDIDPNTIDGTTRERFIEIVSCRSARDQAKIVRGVLERFPPGGEHAPDTRTPGLEAELRQAASRIEGISVEGITPDTLRADVHQAIDDADLLLSSPGGAAVSVDRVHTSLHAFLLALCDENSIDYPDEPTMAKLLKSLRSEHPRLATGDKAALDAQKVLQSFGQAFDALNPIRNSSSMAHPNAGLLDEPEALLIVNAGRTIMAYLDARLG